MSWNQTAAAELPPFKVSVEDKEILDRWAGVDEDVPTLYVEDRIERLLRLKELAPATLSLTVCGDVEGTITVDLPCDVIVERPGGIEVVVGEPERMAWLIVRLEGIDPVALGSTRLTSFSLAIPGHVGPGLYALDELRRRADSDEVEWWEVDDFHLSPEAHGGETTFYLDNDQLDGAWVATTGASVAFDLPMASVVSEIRVTGTISWSDPSTRPPALARTSQAR